jgi:hypothetical protein
MLRKLVFFSVITLFSTIVLTHFVKAEPKSDDKKVSFNELINETLLHVNERSNFIADDRGPASIYLDEPQPRMFPDVLSKPPKVVERFVVPQLDVPFSEFDSAPLGAGFTYNWQAPWSGF